MKSKIIWCVVCVTVVSFLYSGCRQDAPAFDLEASQYPDDIGQIVLTNCAISGCHNSASAHAAAGLDLTNWETMMQGDRNGAVVIPYSHTYSTLFMFCNTFQDLGPTAEPTMPFNDDPLTREQMLTIRNWINAGAPSRTGKIAFADSRKKYYVTNQGCDVVTVIDQATGLQMRYIPVGSDFSIESPHSLRLSPDGQYWYVCFSNGSYLEKYRTSDDAFVGRALLGDQLPPFGSWNTFAITPDSRFAYVVDWNPSGTGRIARVDLETMQLTHEYGSSIFQQTHGSAISPDGNTLYITTTSGNYIHKIDVSDPGGQIDVEQIIIDGVSPLPIYTSVEDGHEIMFTPDGTQYYITCQGSDNVRVLDRNTDTLVATIPVGYYPQEIMFSHSMPYAFVTCPDDSVTFPGKRGSVYIIDRLTYSVIGTVHPGHQPHGLAIDDEKGEVMIANRNINPGGPAPHHSSVCGGRNGYVTFIDMHSLTLMPGRKLELSADPYYCLLRL